MSQPTLSVGVARLERTLGCQHVVRSNRRIELTDAGAPSLNNAAQAAA